MIEVKESKIHNKGVFAKEDIPKGTKIIEYKGEKITKEEAEKRMYENEYIMEFDNEYDIDGDIEENDAKYVNHSCDPNCECKTKGGKVWFISLRDIKKGEEITFDYDYACEDDFSEIEDFKCRCGSPNCIGYMVSKDYHEELKEHLKKKGSFIRSCKD